MTPEWFFQRGDEASEIGFIGRVLSGIHGMNDLADSVKVVRPEDFYRPRNGLIWAAISDLYRSNRTIAVDSVAFRLGCAGVLDRIGGRDVLLEARDGASEKYWLSALSLLAAGLPTEPLPE